MPALLCAGGHGWVDWLVVFPRLLIVWVGWCFSDQCVFARCLKSFFELTWPGFRSWSWSHHVCWDWFVGRLNIALARPCEWLLEGAPSRSPCIRWMQGVPDGFHCLCYFDWLVSTFLTFWIYAYRHDLWINNATLDLWVWDLVLAFEPNFCQSSDFFWRAMRWWADQWLLFASLCLWMCY